MSRMAPANSRIACWPFVTEYKLHKGRLPHRHMPRMRAPTSTRMPWLGCRTPAESGRDYRPGRLVEQVQQTVRNEPRP